MILSIVAFIMIAAIIICLLKNKTSPVVAFIIFPLVATIGLAIFTNTFGNIGSKGEQLNAIFTWATDGVKLTMNNAVLFLFSITYFGIMNEKGLFDPICQRTPANVSCS